MADNSDSRESDNNSWVIPGPEALPVEDLSLVTSEEILLEVDPATEVPQAPLNESEPLVAHPDLEEAKPKLPTPESQDSEEVPDPLSKGSPGSDTTRSALPLHGKESGGGHGGEEPSGPEQRTLFIHKAGPLGDEPSSEEESAKERDVEGLRRRKGRDPSPPQAGASRDQGRRAPEAEDAGLLQTKWMLGFLALLGLGLLAFLGVTLDVDEGPVDILSAWSGSESEELPDWPVSPSPEPPDAPQRHQAKDTFSAAPGDTPSLEAMGSLLDKLAKENQEIRLMQAELQAQKEDLQALLRKTEGKTKESTSRQESLAAENARLTEALQREVSSLRVAQAELRLLRAKLQGPAEVEPPWPQGEEPTPDHHPPHHKLKAPEAEVQRLRSLLASVHQDLARAFEKVPPSDGARRFRAELDGVEQRLAQEQATWQEGSKARRGKERPWHRKHEDPWPSHREGGLPKGSHPAAKTPKTADGSHHPRKQASARDAKPHWKSRKAKRPAEPSALWEMLAKHRYPAPQACSGLGECARREGLQPVQKTSFLPMVQRYLAGLGWKEHYHGLAAALSGSFGSDGVFAHDRLSFVEFLDEIEDTLEDLAEFLGVSEREVDDFEDMILKQLEAAEGGRSSQPDAGQHPAKEWTRPGPARKNGREFPSQPRG